MPWLLDAFRDNRLERRLPEQHQGLPLCPLDGRAQGLTIHPPRPISVVYCSKRSQRPNACLHTRGKTSHQLSDHPTQSPTTCPRRTLDARAKRISETAVASVQLFTLELSEDEITVLAAALAMLLQECNERAIEARSGASREEVEQFYRMCTPALRSLLDSLCMAEA